MICLGSLSLYVAERKVDPVSTDSPPSPLDTITAPCHLQRAIREHFIADMDLNYVLKTQIQGLSVKLYRLGTAHLQQVPAIPVDSHDHLLERKT